MPMGPAPLGFVYFLGVKFVGYTSAAYILRKAYPDFKGGIVKVGGARTAIGLATGLVYGGLWIFIASKVAPSRDFNFPYLVGLLPLRIAEWLLLLHWFFDRNLKDRQKAVKGAIAGSMWSYCLDAIGIGAAFVIPGGIWVC